MKQAALQLLSLLREAGFSGLLDIGFMSLVVYTILVWFKRTRSAFVLIGILIVSAVYLAARAFNMYLTATVLQVFFTVILVAVVVIFQEEIRHFLEQIAVWSLDRSNRARRKTHRPSRRETEILARTLTDLARDRIGALVVVKGRDALARHLDGGTDLYGHLSEPLLKSIFDPNSIGHDGAVIIDRNRVTQFSCHLPLAKDLQKLQNHAGTRHAAALGLAELTDALCIVVSEERGTISVARNGQISVVKDPSKLVDAIDAFYSEVLPAAEARPMQDFFKKNYREKAAALIITLALWFVFVHESAVIYRSYSVAVRHTEIPANLFVKDLKPARVAVTLSGPRRFFYFLDERRLQITLKLFSARKGIRSYTLSAQDLPIPPGISLEDIEPTSVRIRIEENVPAGAKAEASAP